MNRCSDRVLFEPTAREALGPAGTLKEIGTMNGRIRVTLLAFLALPGVASGQESFLGPSARYGFTLGVSLYEVRDEVLNGLRTGSTTKR
jgi:hypothetical protein